MEEQKDFFIRPAKISDSISLAAFSANAFRAAYDWYNTEEDMNKYVRENFTAAKMESEINDSAIVYLLAYADEELVGYAKLSMQPVEFKTVSERPLEIARLYTKPELIGKGIGKKLIEESVLFAMKNKFDSLCLSAWQQNEKAVSFYKREGFEIAGTTTFVLGTDVQDDFIMVKRLPSI